MNLTKPVTVFVLLGCPYCKGAIQMLKQKRIPFDAVNLGNKPKLAVQLANELNYPTVPKIFVEGQFIGGYGELKNLVTSGQLDHLSRG